MAAGGKGANQAVAAARLGADVALIARVGDDMFADRAIEGYRSEGIATEWILRDPRAPTGVALILVDATGENLISVASGANHLLTPADVELAAERIGDSDALMLQLEVPVPAVKRAAEIAGAAGVPVILDPAPAPDGPPMAELLAFADYVTPNESEATAVTGIPVDDEKSALQAGRRLLELGVEHAILTLGPRGVLVVKGDQSEWIPPVRVEAVDSTAAGDAFNGGLAVALARGDEMGNAVRYASMVAALSVTKMGAQPSLPTEQEVQAFADGTVKPSRWSR